MDDFMSHILGAINDHGARAVRLFPPKAQVLIAFADRLATEVVRHNFKLILYTRLTVDIGWRIRHSLAGKGEGGFDRHVSAGYRSMSSGGMEDSRCHSPSCRAEGRRGGVQNECGRCHV